MTRRCDDLYTGSPQPSDDAFDIVIDEHHGRCGRRLIILAI
jgi:hypothetical protein